MIVYETHSTTVDNEAGMASGWRGSVLSAQGRVEAGELGRRRRSSPRVYTSDLRQAVQTVEVAFGGTGVPVRLDPRLRECDYGEWTGMPVAELAVERPRRVATAFPGGESYLDVVARMRGFLADIDDGVLIVGHAATRFALEHLCRGVPLEVAVAVPFVWRPGWRYRVGRRPPVSGARPGGLSGAAGRTSADPR